MMKERELLELKEKIEEAKQKKSRLEGQKISLLEQLINDYKCKTVKVAKNHLRTLRENLEQLEITFNEKCEELEHLMPEEDEDDE